MKEANKAMELLTFTNLVEGWIKEADEMIANPNLFYPLTEPSSPEVEISQPIIYEVSETRQVKTVTGGNQRMGFFRERMIIHRQVSFKECY